MKEWKKGLTWEQIQFELETNDNHIKSNNKNYIKHKDQILVGIHVGKKRSEVEEEFYECPKHEIKYRGCTGDCPLCFLRTCFEEKQRIGEQGY